MDNAKRTIRKYLITHAAPRIRENDRGYYAGSDVSISALRQIDIVLRLIDVMGPHKGQMSIIVHSRREKRHPSNKVMVEALRTMTGFVGRGARSKKDGRTFGVAGRFYLPATCAWTKLDDATLKAIYDLYQRISGALFDAGLYV